MGVAVVVVVVARLSLVVVVARLSLVLVSIHSIEMLIDFNSFVRQHPERLNNFVA